MFCVTGFQVMIASLPLMMIIMFSGALGGTYNPVPLRLILITGEFVELFSMNSVSERAPMAWGAKRTRMEPDSHGGIMNSWNTRNTRKMSFLRLGSSKDLSFGVKKQESFFHH